MDNGTAIDRTLDWTGRGEASAAAESAPEAAGGDARRLSLGLRRAWGQEDAARIRHAPQRGRPRRIRPTRLPRRFVHQLGQSQHRWFSSPFSIFQIFFSIFSQFFLGFCGIFPLVFHTPIVGQSQQRRFSRPVPICPDFHSFFSAFSLFDFFGCFSYFFPFRVLILPVARRKFPRLFLSISYEFS